VSELERFRRLPVLAQAFIGLALVDAVARTFGLIEPTVGGGEIELFASYVPRDAWILLPALILIRRKTAPRDTPWVHRGAIFIALVTLLGRPIAAIFGSPQTLFVAESVLSGAGFLVLGFGLKVLNPRSPSPAIAGLANLVAIGVLSAFLAGFIASLLTDLRLDIIFSPPWWSYAGGILHGACIAYLVRAVVRGLDDPSRPSGATRWATSGALLWVLGLFGEGLVATSYVITHANTLSAELALGFVLLQSVGPLLIVIGFGLGLADPLRPMAKEWAAALQGDPRPDGAPA